MRAAIYTRVSSTEQAEEGTSLQTQLEVLTQYVENQGWALAQVFEERGVSGAKRVADRPALTALLAAAERGNVDVLVVDKWDRLARNLNEQTTLWGRLDELGVRYVSRCEPESSGTDGILVRQIMGAIAEQERRRIRDRTRTGLNARVRQGGWGGGNVAPWGYSIVGSGPKAHLAVNPREAEAVRMAATLLLDHGLGTLEAAHRLNALGLTPRSAGLWSSQNLRNRLRGTHFGGQWTFGKTNVMGSVEAPIVVEIEPILDAVRFEQLQHHLRATATKRGKAAVHPLSGRLRCVCGAAMTGLARSDRANRRYRCRYGRHEPGRPFCGLPSLRADAVDDLVWTKVLAVLTDPNALLALAEERLELLTTAEVVEADSMSKANLAVARTQASLSRAMARCIAHELDQETTEATIRELRDQHDAAVRHQRNVASMTADTASARQRLTVAHDLAEVARTRLINADRELQSSVFALLDIKVQVVELEHGTGLDVQGSLAHDLLLHGVRDAVAPGIPASAAG